MGALDGFYQVSVVGFILLFPAVLAPSSHAGGKKVPPLAQQQRRVAPRPPMEFSTSPTPAKSAAVEAPPAASPFQQKVNYTSALFPTTLFPTLSQSQPVPIQPQSADQQTKGEKDELLEIGAILAVLKLAFR